MCGWLVSQKECLVWHNWGTLLIDNKLQRKPVLLMQKTMTKYFTAFLKYHKIQVPDGKTKVAQSSNLVYLQTTFE